jgi:predicted nuclease with TOPRIM domain
MEPQMIDHYNELPHAVNVIDKMNEELSEIQGKLTESQKENEKLKKEIEKYKDIKDKEFKFIACWESFYDESMRWFDESDAKLGWFHDFQYILENCDVKISEEYIIMFIEWIHRDTENIDDAPPQYLIQKAYEYEEIFRNKASEIFDKYFDYESDRAIMCDISEPGYLG